ncbi:hypothetical protein M413DRAFT_188741 [Hebeloma cylindrosporum]|uniref:Uncharacterized protein n=1 Tax=Hebeloma cylindrosporum TaxID=76867 RepID=A0A0C3C8P0_HEBCY|nr:hypothetical protein M413DRAFT_188741 [Hebeloma cylindrosporum h7]
MVHRSRVITSTRYVPWLAESQCLGSITTVATFLYSKPLFNSPREKRYEANVCVEKKNCCALVPDFLVHELTLHRGICTS